MRILNLQQKLDKLEYLLGHQFPTAHFSDRALADAIKKSPSAWTRKKRGEPTELAELTQLFMHYKLPVREAPHRLEPDVFTFDYEQFCDALREARVGIYGPGEAQLSRQMMVQNPRSSYGGIRLKRVAKLRAGLGDAKEMDQRPATEVLFVGGKATIEIDVPKPGYLLVIDDQIPFGEARCLVPSWFAGYGLVTKRLLRVPEPGSPRSALDVLGAPGWYRVFAIWTPNPLSEQWSCRRRGDEGPQKMSDEVLEALASELQKLAHAGHEMSIMIGDYRVTE